MKVLAVEARDHYFAVTLGRDGRQMIKFVRLGDLEDVICGLKRAAREADRDISVMTHGDLEHCEDPTANRKRA